MKQERGQLTDRIKEKSEKLLGYEITVKELRLMPYLQYVMANEQVIKMESVNTEERKILSKWRESGHIEGRASGLLITKAFWNIMCELIFLGYGDLG